MQLEYPEIRAPSYQDKVYKDQCLFSFQTPDMIGGLNVCLHCYQGFAPLDQESNYTFLHYSVTGHSLFLNIKKFFQQDVQREHLQKRMKLEKLQILDEDEDVFYKTHYQLVSCDSDEVVDLAVDSENQNSISSDLPENIKSAVTGVINTSSAAHKSVVAAWEQEIVTCKHSTAVEKKIPDNYKLENTCSDCGLAENLWLCLHCGNIGCGREQFGGLKGNSHALAHYESAKDHHLAVKLGSLSLSKGKADCYCYTCQDEVKVPNLVNELASLGIKSGTFNEQNEKTLTEINIQQNLTWQFNMESEDGNAFRPIYGKGLVGLKNLGNSCYLNTCVQLLTHLKSFQDLFYGKDFMNFPHSSLSAPYNDLYLNLIKIFNGLVSDKYSTPNVASTDAIKWQKGLNLQVFKSIVGQKHRQYLSQEQQDSFEFLVDLLDQMEEYYYTNFNKESSCFAKNPMDSLSMVMQSKLTSDAKYKLKHDLESFLFLNVEEELAFVDDEGKDHYKKVDMNDALKALFTSTEDVLSDGITYKKTIKLASLPEALLVRVPRAKIVNWSVKKTDVPVVIPNGEINLTDYIVTSDEIEKAQNSPSFVPDEPEPETPAFVCNPDVLPLLLEMGFSESRCKWALFSTGNTADPEVATNWLFENMDVSKYDEPFVPEAQNDQTNEPSPELLANLTEMGFSQKLSKKALIVNNMNPEAAVEWLFSNPDDDGELEPLKPAKPSVTEKIGKFLKEKGIKEGSHGKYVLKAIACHKGQSTGTGHYVAFVKTIYEGEPRWVLYNDEKVVLAEDKKTYEEMEKNGYMYLFVRKGGENDDVSL